MEFKLPWVSENSTNALNDERAKQINKAYKQRMSGEKRRIIQTIAICLVMCLFFQGITSFFNSKFVQGITNGQNVLSTSQIDFSSLSDKIFKESKENIVKAAKTQITEEDFKDYEDIIISATEEFYDELTDSEKSVIENNVKSILIPYTTSENDLIKDKTKVSRELAEDSTSILSNIDNTRTVYSTLMTSNEEIEDFQNQINAINQSITNLETALTNQENSTTTEINNINSNYADLVQQFETFNNNFAAYKTENNTKFETIANNITEINKTIENNYTDLSSLVETTNTDLTSLVETTNTDLTENINTLRTDIQNQIGNLTEITVSDYISNSETEEAKTIVDYINQINNAITNLNADDVSNMEATNQKIDELKQYTDDHFEEMDEQMQQEVETLNNTIDQTKTDLTNLINESNAATQQAISDINNQIGNISFANIVFPEYINIATNGDEINALITTLNGHIDGRDYNAILTDIQTIKDYLTNNAAAITSNTAEGTETATQNGLAKLNSDLDTLKSGTQELTSTNTNSNATPSTPSSGSTPSTPSSGSTTSGTIGNGVTTGGGSTTSGAGSLVNTNFEDEYITKITNITDSIYYVNDRISQLGQQGLANKYDSNKSYNAGEFVLYNDTLYYVNSNVAAGSGDPSTNGAFTYTTVGQQLTSIYNDIKTTQTELQNFETNINNEFTQFKTDVNQQFNTYTTQINTQLGNVNLRYMSQSEYNALSTKDPNTVYFVY